MDAGSLEEARETGTQRVETVGDGRFRVQTTEWVNNRGKRSNATDGYRYAVLATLLNVGFFSIAIASGIYIVGRFMLVPVFFIMVIMVLAQLFAHFNTTAWRSTTHPIENYPDIEALIETVCDEMGVDTPSITIYESSNPHAKIMPLIGKSVIGKPANRLYLTTSLMESFDDVEIAAIIAHEIAHIHHSDPYFRTFSALSRTTTMLTGWGIILMATRSAFMNAQAVNGDPYGTLVSLPLALTVGGLIFLGGWVLDSQYKQTAEYIADSTASNYTSAAAVHQMLLDLAPGGLDENVVDPYPLFKNYPPMQNRIKRMKAKMSIRGVGSEGNYTTDQALNSYPKEK